MKAGWKAGQIGDVCTVIAGQSPKGSAYNDDGVGLPFYQGKKEFRDRHIGPPTTWTSVVTKEGESGDILMSVRAPVGPINEATQRICIGRGLAAIRAKDGLDRDFLWYALLWLQPTIKGSAGAVFDSINKAGIESLPIPLPPLEEQQRIVAVLDEAFEGLARARAHAEANLQNARELFDNFATGIFSQTLEEHGQTTLKDVCEFITDGTHQTPTYFDSGFLFLSAKNIKDGQLDWKDVKYIDEVQHIAMQKRLAPRLGDLLIRKNGAGYGAAALVDRDVIFDVYVSLAVLRPKNFILPEYMLQFANSSFAQSQFKDRIKGQGVPNLHLQEIRQVKLPVPNDIRVQKDIADKIQTAFEAIRVVESTYQKKLQDLDDLRRSLLQKAFAGELT
ncbi:restriction endonuclease subunit S [Antarctobacter sp.]|uniref:restriction endonuclease subunit S n=1 Tax=Antarctobacter sp. TaxID=1872577 RepID=UPI003A92C4FB